MLAHLILFVFWGQNLTDLKLRNMVTAISKISHLYSNPCIAILNVWDLCYNFIVKLLSKNVQFSQQMWLLHGNYVTLPDYLFLLSITHWELTDMPCYVTNLRVSKMKVNRTPIILDISLVVLLLLQFSSLLLPLSITPHKFPHSFWSSILFLFYDIICSLTFFYGFLFLPSLSIYTQPSSNHIYNH